MPIVECKDCKTMVSTSAELCPKCGAKHPASYISSHTPSKVVVHRKSSLVGMAAKMSIYVDGEKMGEIKQDEMITFDLPFGDHTIKAKANVFGGNSGQTLIRILPEKVYQIEVNFSFLGANFESYVTDL